MLQMVLW